MLPALQSWLRAGDVHQPGVQPRSCQSSSRFQCFMYMTQSCGQNVGRLFSTEVGALRELHILSVTAPVLGVEVKTG